MKPTPESSAHTSQAVDEDAVDEFDDFVVQDEVGGDVADGEPEYVVLDEVEGDGSGIHFRAVFTQKSFDGLVQDTRFEVVERPQRDMTRFLGALVGTLRPWMHAALRQRHGISYWVSVQLQYIHPMKELKDMQATYLHTGTQRLLREDEIEQHLDKVREVILLRHAHFIRQSSGLVVDEILNCRFKVSNFHPLPGRAYRQMPEFLAKKHAIINVQNEDNR